MPAWTGASPLLDPASTAMAAEIDALRARLEAFDGAMPTVHLDPALVRPSRWSHRHESAYASQAFNRLLDSVGSAGGIEQPILVRKDGAGYEVIFGHRRHRACLELGLAVFAVVWAGPMSDVDLFLALERENQGRQDLSPFEQGRMYDHALVMHLFSSQRRLASAVGVSHTWIRKTIQIARLPKDVIGAFADPTAIQPAHAADITKALTADEEAVMRRAADLAAPKHSPPSIRRANSSTAWWGDRPQRSRPSHFGVAPGPWASGGVTANGEPSSRWMPTSATRGDGAGCRGD